MSGSKASPPAVGFVQAELGLPAPPPAAVPAPPDIDEALLEAAVTGKAEAALAVLTGDQRTVIAKRIARRRRLIKRRAVAEAEILGDDYEEQLIASIDRAWRAKGKRHK